MTHIEISNKTPRILIFRRDYIGDLLCTGPFIAALREVFPQAYLAIVVNTYSAPVLKNNPHLDKIYFFTKHKHREPGTSRLSNIWERITLIRKLQLERFDWIVLASSVSVFDNDGLKTARWIHAKHILAFSNVPKKGLTDALPLLDPAIHEVECMWPFLEHIVRKENLKNNNGTLLSLPVPGPLWTYTDKHEVARARANFVGSHGSSKVIAVHLSARKVGNRLSLEMWLALLQSLLALPLQQRLVLFWSPGKTNNPRHPGDDELASTLFSKLGNKISLCPTTTLPQLIVNVAACDLFLGADGGAVHIAAAVGCPVLGLYERNNFVIYKHWAPWKVDHEVVYSETGTTVADIPREKIVAAYIKLFERLPPSLQVTI